MFGKKGGRKGPDADAQHRASTPEAEALEIQRDYMERMLTHWIQGSERYVAMPDFIPRINGFLKRIGDARSLAELSTINTEFTAFADEANRLIKK